jgi:TonB family protein
MQYLLQYTIYTALFYTVYLLFLKNRASHQWNRFYLLLCAAAPLVLPLIKIPALYNAAPIAAGSINTFLPATTIFSHKYLADTHSFNWGELPSAVYLFFALLLLLRSVYQFLLFKRFVKLHHFEIINGVKVLFNTNAGPGSFLDYIFLPGQEIDPLIFDHELAHIQLKHSRDILFIRLLQCVFWPNLALYFILKELKIVHEFQADACAVKNEASYISVLLNDVFNTRQFSFSHTFFFHPLKRRIMMLHKPVNGKTMRRAKFRAITFATFLIAGFIYLQSCSHTDNMTILSQNLAVNDKTVYNMVDSMPKAGFDLSEYISKNIKYPGSARERGIEGKVIVRFVVDEEGNVVNPVILKSPDTTFSTEALRVMKRMPKWIPGKLNGNYVAVNFTLPILFLMDNDKSVYASDQFHNGLSKQENDSLMNLIGKTANNKNALSPEENASLVGLLQRTKK